jgi:hypothetical protein
MAETATGLAKPAMAARGEIADIAVATWPTGVTDARSHL